MQGEFNEVPLADIVSELTAGNTRQAKLVSTHGIGG